MSNAEHLDPTGRARQHPRHSPRTDVGHHACQAQQLGAPDCWRSACSSTVSGNVTPTVRFSAPPRPRGSHPCNSASRARLALCERRSIPLPSLSGASRRLDRAIGASGWRCPVSRPGEVAVCRVTPLLGLRHLPKRLTKPPSPAGRDGIRWTKRHTKCLLNDTHGRDDTPWTGYSSLITRRSQVQILPPPPTKHQVRAGFRQGAGPFHWRNRARCQRLVNDLSIVVPTSPPARQLCRQALLAARPRGLRDDAHGVVGAGWEEISAHADARQLSLLVDGTDACHRARASIHCDPRRRLTENSEAEVLDA